MTTDVFSVFVITYLECLLSSYLPSGGKCLAMEVMEIITVDYIAVIFCIYRFMDVFCSLENVKINVGKVSKNTPQSSEQICHPYMNVEPTKICLNADMYCTVYLRLSNFLPGRTSPHSAVP